MRSVWRAADFLDRRQTIPGYRAPRTNCLEHPRDPPHGVLADEDGRHENHVAPHEQAEEEAARALHNIKPRRPTAFPRFLVQSNSSDDIDCFTHTRILDVRETDFLLRPTLH